IINAISAAKRDGELPFSLSTPELNPLDPTTKPLRVIADHVRAAIFMAADGITPGNTGRDYMMRRFIRRAYLTGRALGLDKPFLHRIVPIVEQSYGATYPELGARRDIISDLIRREEERFGVTIESGMNRLDDLIDDAKSKGKSSLSGAEVFSLYSSQGFPPELTSDILQDAGLSFDEEEFQIAAEKHSEISGSAVGEYQKREFAGLETEFLGYETTRADAKIVALRVGGGAGLTPPSNRGEASSSPEVAATEGNTTNETNLQRLEGGVSPALTKLVLDRSPFYAESGGQTGDVGEIVGENGRAVVLDTKKEGKTWVHLAQIEGELREGDAVTAIVDSSRRRAVERAHSSTHLLHASLREHLGKHVEQRGSSVEADRLRFDFVHFAPISPDDLLRVENTVNQEILKSEAINIEVKPIAEARAMGAMALFGEKYGDEVRTVKMGDFSLELCGGTHLPVTSAAGLFRIVSEGGVGANVRRVEALTGVAALEYDRAQAEKLREIALEIGARPENALAAAEKLKNRVRDLEKQLADAQKKLSGGAADEILSGASEIKSIRFASGRAPQGVSGNALRDLADSLAQKLDGVVVLAVENEGKVTWAVKASKAAVEAGAHAGNIVKGLAQITGGGGGGRPDFAQAGGKDASKIDEALGKVGDLI
ncbi:MAG TPA: alanine--tRNA ligase-related protein, partial [Abditibacterium sp.]